MGVEMRALSPEDNASPSGIRAWQDGDSMKNIHWKLSARRRELLVRTFEESARPDVLILMDCAPVNALRSHIRTIEDVLCEAAAGAALNAFNKELLASHIRTCVVEDIRDGKDEVIDELVATLQKLMK